MPQPKGYICRDFGRPGCCSIPDERYTMRFDDIGEEPIYWCTFCGKEAKMMDDAIQEALKTRPGFADDFKTAIEEAEAKRCKHERLNEEGYCRVCGMDCSGIH